MDRRHSRLGASRCTQSTSSMPGLRDGSARCAFQLVRRREKQEAPDGSRDRTGAKQFVQSPYRTKRSMTKLTGPRRRRNGRVQSLPLLELLERRRWDDAPRVARWVAKRCRIASPSAARLIAELASLGDE